MTKNQKTLINLSNYLKKEHLMLYGSIKDLIDLTNLFPFNELIHTNHINEINQISFFEENHIKIIIIDEPELVKHITNKNNKIILSTKYNGKFTKITRELLINIYENHFNMQIPCDIKTQIEQTKTNESVYSTILKIKLNNNQYNPKHTPINAERDHPIYFFLQKEHSNTLNPKYKKILQMIIKILHKDFLITGNITLSSYFKLIEKILNKD